MLDHLFVLAIKVFLGIIVFYIIAQIPGIVDKVIEEKKEPIYIIGLAYLFKITYWVIAGGIILIVYGGGIYLIWSLIKWLIEVVI